MDIRKVVLIHPGREGRIWGRATGAPYTLMRLASLVPDEIPVEIWDENLGPLGGRLRQLGPHDLVGITSKTLAIESAERFAKIAHRAGVRAVVVGGAHATLMPEDVARWADVVVTGEAYYTWPQIIHDFLHDTLKPHYHDSNWADLAGVAPISDRVIRLVDENRHYWTPMMEITRGCPRNCSFCTAVRVSGQRMRLRPIDEVVDEIQRRRIKRFFLTDDNFGLAFRTNPDYIEALCRALATLPLHGWTAQAEMLVSTHPDLLHLARHAHLDKLFIGFESVNPENRRDLGGKSKGLISQYKKAIKEVQACGIGVVGLFVFGFDHDTPQTLMDTWDFVRESELDSVSMTILTPYPGTPFRAQLIEEGRLMADKPWRYYDTAHVTYYPKRMTVAELEQTYDWVCRQAYSPASIARRGLRALGRHPVPHLPRKVFGSFSTDYGYRRTYDWRQVHGSRLLNAWGTGE
ncbi:MAG: B12-binding domain-containing radical SAM protein [Anaerolineae bacterium]|nr:B12-binding domain-containing radical SAM protein [Anaerolineae bacterium]